MWDLVYGLWSCSSLLPSLCPPHCFFSFSCPLQSSCLTGNFVQVYFPFISDTKKESGWEKKARDKGRLMRRAWLQSEDSDLLSDKMKISRISASSLSIYGCMVACVFFAVCVCGGALLPVNRQLKYVFIPHAFTLYVPQKQVQMCCVFEHKAHPPTPSTITLKGFFLRSNICVKVKNSAHVVPTNTDVQAVQTYIHKARWVCTNNFLHTSRWKHPDKQYYIILRQFMWTLCTHLYRHLIIK